MRRAASSRFALPAIAALLIAIVALAAWLPWWTEDRAVTTATPTPPPFQTITPIALAPGERVCESLVALEPATRAATVLSAEGVTDGPPLRIVARADGYRAAGRVPGGYGQFEGLQAPLDPPSEPVIGEVCVRNVGDERVELQGTTEGRVQTRSQTTVDGEPSEARLSLVLGQVEARALADRPGQLLDRIAAFKPPIVGDWSLAILALLVLLGVPAAVVYAIARGIADEQ